MHTVGDPQNNSIIKPHGHLKFCVKLTTTCCFLCYLTWLYQTNHHLLLFVSPHVAIWSAIPNWPPLVALHVTSHGWLKCCAKLTITCCSSCHFTWPSEVLCQTEHHLLLFVSLDIAVWSTVPNWTPLAALHVTPCGHLKCCAKLTIACCSLCHLTWESQVLYQTDHCLPHHITGNNKSPVAPGTSDLTFCLTLHGTVC